MKFVITAALFLVILIPMVAYYAWALQAVWNWYVPSIGGPTISFPSAIGISMLVGYMTQKVPKTEEPDDIDWERFGLFMVRPVLLVGFAWVCLQIWPVT